MRFCVLDFANILKEESYSLKGMADSGESVRDLNEATKALTQKLAGNDKTLRDKAIKKLRSLIEKRQKNDAGGINFNL